MAVLPDLHPVPIMTFAVVSALHSCELQENSNLIDILSLIRSSRSSAQDAKLASLVRGLCTHNSSLLNIIKLAQENFSGDEIDSFKQLVNQYINWFDAAIVVFEKYFLCFPLEYDYAIVGKPILHLGCYCAFIDSTIATLRNPFVIEKLSSNRSRITDLLASYSRHCDLRKLNDITFANVVSLTGGKVSASFNLLDIVYRTENAPVLMGFQSVELVLLKLPARHAVSTSDAGEYNAFAILKMPTAGETSRSLMFPPFRMNEVDVVKTPEGMTISSISYFNKPSSVSLLFSSPVQGLIDDWYNKLYKIFLPTLTINPPQPLNFSGLGISCLGSDDSSIENDASPVRMGNESFTPPSEVFSEVHSGKDMPRRSSVQIMRKALDTNSVKEAEEVSKTLNVIDNSHPHHSVRAEFDYADEVDSFVGSDDESLSCFEVVHPPPRKNAISVTKSLPDLHESKPQHQVYTTAAGSAINISEFGKNYNPSFCQEHEDGLPMKPNPMQKRKSIFNIFKKKSKEPKQKEVPTEKEAPKQEETQPAEPPKPSQPVRGQLVPNIHQQPPELPKKDREINLKKHTMKDRLDPPPPLDLSATRLVSTGSLPSSATSASFSRTLPLPFALPLSTSTYFFKPYANGNDSMPNSASQSTTSLVQPGEGLLEIPDDLKEVINSEESIDFYISPTSPQQLKISKWKQKYGKWEMLTTNDRIFIKIVANYSLHKSWLLAFKEEYDEEYQEVIDKALIIVDLDGTASARRSSALDLQLKATDSITGEKHLIMMRCLDGKLMTAIDGNLTNILAVMLKPPTKTVSAFESSSTITSSLMSKPSHSLTLASLNINDVRPRPLLPQIDRPQVEEGLNKLLLDRFTVRVHKQMEGYDRIHHLLSWKTMSMFTLNILHTVDSVDRSMYYFSFDNHLDEADEDEAQFTWVFEESTIPNKIERIGKAGLLVKVSDDEMYMVECKGKKELRRLWSLF